VRGGPVALEFEGLPLAHVMGMLQRLARVALLLGTFSVSAGQTNVSVAQDASPRPVRDITEPPSAAQVALLDFKFQEPSFRSFAPIDSEPVIGAEYVVEAHVDGEHAVATMKFEIVDDTGIAIAPIAIGRQTRSGFPRYLGVMTVPAHPFRIVLTGHTVNGEPFRRADDKVFRPIERAAPRPQSSHGLPAGWIELIERLVEDKGPQLIAEVKADLASKPSAVMAIPRMEVFNVTYAPLFSAQGRPIGLRIAYDAKFSETGQFNPAVEAEGKYDNDGWQGRTRMEVLDSTITPMPSEAFRPYGPVILNDIRTSPLQSGATYTYEEGTVYHFTADLVPDFIVHNLNRSKACIYYQRYRSSPWAQKPFAEILTYEGPTTYSVLVGGRRALVENFFSEGTFHRSFVAEGAQDCGPQPTRRF